MTEAERNERLEWIHRHQVEDDEEDSGDHDDVPEEAVWEKGFEEEIVQATPGSLLARAQGELASDYYL